MIEIRFAPMTQWPRPITTMRRRAPFKVTYDQTLRHLRHELHQLGVNGVVVVSAFFAERDIRQDGMPRSDARAPVHPGVALNFTGKHGPLKFLCDACIDWRDNLRAIGLTLERLRLADLYGVTSRGEQYTGWKQLPNAIVTPPPMTLGEAADWICTVTSFDKVLTERDVWSAAKRVAVKRFHPDTNEGRHLPEWDKLQQAVELLDRHHGL